MKTLRLTAILMLAFVLLIATAANAQTEKPKIQIALLLDTSNSMDGLIDQAKTQLWKIVNELATAQYKGVAPELEIALYEYGNDNLPAAEGFIRLVSNFTTDLDKISEDLFALKTYGGDEYCGHVIEKASKQLSWANSNEYLKLIFIAGNEPFNQGKVDYINSCKAAIAKGIAVNTIFCGNYNEGVTTKWKEGADLADGKYMNIDQNLQTAYIESPFDDKILELNNSLNDTYIGYGASGAKLKERQMVQDSNAGQMSKSAAVSRSFTKSSAKYKNSNWDLVDAVEESSVKLEDMETNDLPDEMKNLKPDERKKFVENKKNERAKIQAELKDLQEKRDKFVADKKRDNAEENTLDAAMIKVVRVQAENKQYQFKK